MKIHITIAPGKYVHMLEDGDFHGIPFTQTEPCDCDRRTVYTKQGLTTYQHIENLRLHERKYESNE